MPPFRLRTKSIALGTPAVASTPASCPAPDGQLDDRQAASLELCRAARPGAPAPSGTGRRGRSARTRAPRAAGRTARRRDARASTVSVTRAGITFDRAGLDLDLPDGGDRVLDRPCRLLDPEDLAGRLHQRVVANAHRRRARVALPALDDDRPAHHAGDAGHDPERRAGVGEPRPLLDVQLEEGVRQLAARRPAPCFRRSRAPRHGRRRPSRGRCARPPRSRRRRRARRRTSRPRGRCRGASPIQTPGADPFGSVPTRFPAGSTVTARPASSIHIRARSCAASSSGE